MTRAGEIRVLIACEFSGRVRDAFAACGFDAWSCDLRPSETLGQHYQGDVRDMLQQRWDLAIFHPPCTYLCNSGVRWLYNPDGTRNAERWQNMQTACDFFKWCLNADVPHIAVENPVMHGHAKRIIDVKQTQVIQPWQHGDGCTKATCLWLKNLPPLQPSNIVDGRRAEVHRMAPSPERERERSRTYHGIAAAMAQQFGDAILNSGHAADRE